MPLRTTGIIRLVRDPSLKQSGELSVCKFSGARNERQKGEDKPHYYNCVAFGRKAEVINEYFSKGSRIMIDGKLKMNQWEDKEGRKRTDFEITVEDFDFVDRKKENQGNQEESKEDMPF